MTALTTTSIILAFLLGATIMIAIRHYNSAKRLYDKNNSLRNAIAGYKASESDTNAIYRVCRSAEHNGNWSVCRTSIHDGSTHHSVIKVFTDEDDDFNLNEARELADKINE